MSFSENAKEPFIAWSCAHDYNVFAPAFQRSCERHLREAQGQISSLIGPPAVEGIILYDRLERGMAVAALLQRDGLTLPLNGDGASCDNHFDEDALCDATNELSFQARIHAGSRGMLVRTGENGDRAFILLDQREAAQLHPQGRKDNPDLSLAAFGLLAHELGHAKDCADGRPGLASKDEVQAVVASGRADAVHTITDMALAEYVATRAECRAQVTTHGACSESLTRRIGQMARQELTLSDLDFPTPTDNDALQQRQMDLSGLGYHIGTLAAYHEARAPIHDENGGPSRLRTDQLLARRTTHNSVLGDMLDKTAPALERAAHTPDMAARKDLASTIETAIIEAQQAQQERARPKARDTSIEDWFSEL